jgi:hypothetical protein
MRGDRDCVSQDGVIATLLARKEWPQPMFVLHGMIATLR